MTGESRMSEAKVDDEALEARSREVIGGFHGGAARYYREAIWKVVPGDYAFSVRSDDLGLADAVIVSIGQDGDVWGWVLFRERAHYTAFLRITDSVALGSEPVIPPHVSLFFHRRAEHSPRWVRLIRENGWEVAGRYAYPDLTVVDDRGDQAEPRGRDYLRAEVLSRGLAEVARSLREQGSRPWTRGEEFRAVLSIDTAFESFEVTMATLARPELSGFGSADPLGVLFRLDALESGADELGAEARDAEERLIQEFERSEFAAELWSFGGVRILMDLVRQHVGGSLASLSPAQLHAMMFTVLPTELHVEPADGAVIVAELHAFYLFLEAEYGLEWARPYVWVLEGDAVGKWRAEVLAAQAADVEGRSRADASSGPLGSNGGGRVTRPSDRNKQKAARRARRQQARR